MTRAPLALTITLGITLVASSAFSCAHSIRMRLDPESNMMRVVQTQIRGHRYQAAARTILRTWPDIRTRVASRSKHNHRTRIMSPFGRSNPAVNLRRARLAMATAVVRTDGHLKASKGWSGRNPHMRLADLRWAAKVFRQEVARVPHSLVMKTRLGEALSRLPWTRGEAYDTLSKVAAKGVMPEGMGWAALADLRDELGDRPGSKKALRQCRKLDRKTRACRRYLGKRTLHVAGVYPQMAR